MKWEPYESLQYTKASDKKASLSKKKDWLDLLQSSKIYHAPA